MSFRLLHTADLHLDQPFGGVGPTPPELTARLATAGLDTLDRLVDVALASQVDALVIAGGLWTGARPQRHTSARVAAAFARLAEGGVSTIVARHAPERSDLVLNEVARSPLVHLMPAAPPTTVVVRGRDGSALTVAVASGLDGLDALVHRPPPGDGSAQVAVVPLPLRDAGHPAPALKDAAMDYWALGGRLPAQAARLEAGGGWVVMAGTPQLHQMPEPGVGCGAVLVDVERGSTAAPRWVDVAAVELISFRVPLVADVGVDAVEAHLDQQAAQLAASRPGRVVALRAVANGVGEARAALVDPAARAALLTRLRRRAADRGGVVWWVDVQLRPLPSAAADRLIGRDRRAADVLAAAVRARATGPALLLANTSGAADPRRWPPPSGAGWMQLVTDSTSLAFDLLEDEERAADAASSAYAAGVAASGNGVSR